MVQLAERRPAAVTLGAALALTAVASFRTGGSPAALPPAPVETATVPEVVVEQAPVEDNCPAFVRDYLRLETWAVVRCVRGRFGAPGYFVHATYWTTERWERFGIVGDDGSLLVPMVDRPMLRSLDFRAADLDGDGVDEIVGSQLGCSEVALDVMTIYGSVFAVTSQLVPVEPRAGCRLPQLSIEHRELHIVAPDSRPYSYRLDRGWLVEVGS